MNTERTRFTFLIPTFHNNCKETKNANKLHTSRQSEDSVLKRKKKRQKNYVPCILCTYLCKASAIVPVLNVGDIQI